MLVVVVGKIRALPHEAMSSLGLELFTFAPGSHTQNIVLRLLALAGHSVVITASPFTEL